MTPSAHALPRTQLRELKALKRLALHWAQSYPYVAVLDNCLSEVDQYGSYELLIGVAGHESQRYTSWEMLQIAEPAWRMGVFPYELKNRFSTKLRTRKPAEITFPEVAWFEPEILLMIPRGGDRLYEITPDGTKPFP